jgi:hypothetical protein
MSGFDVGAAYGKPQHPGGDLSLVNGIVHRQNHRSNSHSLRFFASATGRVSSQKRLMTMISIASTVARSMIQAAKCALEAEASLTQSPRSPKRFPKGSLTLHIWRPFSIFAGPRYKVAPNSVRCLKASSKPSTSQSTAIPNVPVPTFSSAVPLRFVRHLIQEIRSQTLGIGFCEPAGKPSDTSQDLLSSQVRES